MTGLPARLRPARGVTPAAVRGGCTGRGCADAGHAESRVAKARAVWFRIPLIRTTGGGLRGRVDIRMTDSDRSTPPPGNPLGAARQWLWRHSSQPNGEPWDRNPERLDRAARELLTSLAARLVTVAHGMTQHDDRAR